MLWIVLMSITGFAAVVAATVGIARVTAEGGSQVVAAREAQNQAALEDLFIRDITPRQITAYTAVAAVVVALVAQVLLGSLWLALILGALILLAPQLIFSYLRGKRLDRFNDQLPDALTVLANSTRAGFSLTQAIEQVSEQMDGPVAQEMGLIAQEISLGNDLGRSIENARQRIGSRNFGLVATALQINRERGGNLPQALESMANALQEIWRMDQKLLTASAEGRKAVTWISAMPVLIFLLVSAMQPSLPGMFVSSIFGLALLFLALILYGGGLFWLLRVLRRDA